MSAGLQQTESDFASAIRELQDILGDRLSLNSAIREQHGRGEGHHPGMAPDAVAFAETTEEVAKIVQICASHHMPVISFGTGTSLEGHVAALKGGLCIDLSLMNQILEVSPDDLDCLVQPGVRRKELNEHLRDTGLFFPIDPGANASIGGMTATRASGTNAVRYGTMREVVLGLTVVTADGKVIKTGGRARKSAAGYDLTRLFVGSEGTLGVITEIRLRLFGIPEAMSAAVCTFPDVRSAVDTVIMTIQAGVPVARIELLDALQMQHCIAYSKLEGFDAAPTLFYEFHGSEAGVSEQSEMAQGFAEEHGGTAFRWATKTEDRNQLWDARHNAYNASMSQCPGKKGWATDVCVPISRLSDCITATQADLDQSGLTAPIVGHVGDGNFHISFMINPDDAIELERAMFVNKRMVRRALRMGGTCTGEHGIGHGKKSSLIEEHGEAISLMTGIKKALDPDNIMNPGKIIDI